MHIGTHCQNPTVTCKLIQRYALALSAATGGQDPRCDGSAQRGIRTGQRNRNVRSYNGTDIRPRAKFCAALCGVVCALPSSEQGEECRAARGPPWTASKRHGTPWRAVNSNSQLHSVSANVMTTREADNRNTRPETMHGHAAGSVRGVAGPSTTQRLSRFQS